MGSWEVKSGAGPGACFLSDRSGVGRDSWGYRSCSCRAFEGPSSSSSRRQNRTADRSCSKFMDSWQVRDEKVVSGKAMQSAFLPLSGLPPVGLRARMASLRQGCGDLRGLVSTFTQSCQGSLSEAQGQVRILPLQYLSYEHSVHCPSQGSLCYRFPFPSFRSCLYQWASC